MLYTLSQIKIFEFWKILERASTVVKSHASPVADSGLVPRFSYGLLNNIKCDPMLKSQE